MSTKIEPTNPTVNHIAVPILGHIAVPIVIVAHIIVNQYSQDQYLNKFF